MSCEIKQTHPIPKQSHIIIECLLGCKAAPQKTSPVFSRDRFLRPARWLLHQLFVCILVARADQLHLAPDTQNSSWQILAMDSGCSSSFTTWSHHSFCRGFFSCRASHNYWSPPIQQEVLHHLILITSVKGNAPWRSTNIPITLRFSRLFSTCSFSRKFFKFRCDVFLKGSCS